MRVGLGAVVSSPPYTSWNLPLRSQWHFARLLWMLLQRLPLLSQVLPATMFPPSLRHRLLLSNVPVASCGNLLNFSAEPDLSDPSDTHNPLDTAAETAASEQSALDSIEDTVAQSFQHDANSFLGALGCLAPFSFEVMLVALNESQSIALH